LDTLDVDKLILDWPLGFIIIRFLLESLHHYTASPTCCCLIIRLHITSSSDEVVIFEFEHHIGRIDFTHRLLRILSVVSIVKVVIVAIIVSCLMVT
jgi:hypothetical protein